MESKAQTKERPKSTNQRNPSNLIKLFNIKGITKAKEDCENSKDGSKLSKSSMVSLLTKGLQDKFLNKLEELDKEEKIRMNNGVSLNAKTPSEEDVKRILIMNPAHRTCEDLTHLSVYFNQFDLLSKILEHNNSAEMRLRMYRSLKFKQAKQGEHVFKFGDFGDLYYILIKGAVDVIVPIPEEHMFTKYQLLRHCIINKDDIYLHETDPEKQNPLLEHIHKILNNEKKMDALLKKSEEEILSQREKYVIKTMTKVHNYVPGEGFGELALTNSKPRAASILATEDSQFAVLSKRDFEIIIGEAVKKDFDKKTTVLRNIPAFTHLTRNSLKKLTFYMSEHSISKDCFLFKENEEIQGLYLIKSGDFEISQKFRKELKEKYTGHAFPVKVKRNIKCCLAGNNEALGLEYIIAGAENHTFSCYCVSTQGTYYFLDRKKVSEWLKNRMIKEKFIEMYNDQQKLFSERLSTNTKLLDLEISIIQDEIIKSNARKEDQQASFQAEQGSTKELKVRLLNHLLKQNNLGYKSQTNELGPTENELKLADGYYKVLNNPDKIIKEYNQANKYENNIRISAKKMRRTKSARPGSRPKTSQISNPKIKERPRKEYIDVCEPIQEYKAGLLNTSKNRSTANFKLIEKVYMTTQGEEIENITDANKTLIAHFKKTKLRNTKRIQSAVSIRRNVRFQSSKTTFMSTEKEGVKQSKYETTVENLETISGSEKSVKYNKNSSLSNLRENVVKYMNKVNLNVKIQNYSPHKHESKSLAKRSQIKLIDVPTPRNAVQAANNLINTIDYLEKHQPVTQKPKFLVKNSRNRGFSNVQNKNAKTDQLILRSPNIIFDKSSLNPLQPSPIKNPEKGTNDEFEELETKMFMTLGPKAYEGPVKSAQSATSLPRKIITKKNRLASIHPLYRNQWKKYKKRRHKALNYEDTKSEQKKKVLKISKNK
ncbi:unnamed protein product [Moneuplotes crassus]|uniref:Cyclic nucleotide-binding domain-containing protein n=2 Tax=Euplotes crassus TaxID=5936 RepID=A0AAD1XZR2_EUPCR|nr:unnamed protein product [Moneuplotes crassus]